MNVVGYARVSTDEQAREGVSLADQDYRVRAFIAERGWQCAEVFADKGISGSVPFAMRPAGGAAFDSQLAIVVTAWDRLGRDAADFLAVVRDREVHSITEQGEPPLLRDLRAVLAQEERRKIAERTRAAAAELHRQGRYNGPRPLGYRFDGGILRPVPTEQPTVARIFSEFIAGRGISQITRALNADQVPTVRGGKWRTATVRSVLANPVYVGQVRMADQIREGLHEAILEREVFDRARLLLGAMRDAPGRARGRRPKANHLFIRGLLRCGECGEAMVPRTNGGYADYLCSGRQIAGCEMPIVGRRKIDTAVYRYFESVGLDVAATHEALRQGHDRKLAEITQLAAHADAERQRAIERLARVKRDYQDGHLDAADWSEQRDELTAELRAAKAEAVRLRASEDEIRRDTAHLDVERATLRRLTEIRRAVAGEVKPAEGVDAARAALTRLFERFILHRSLPERIHVELIGEPWIEPVIRAEAIAGAEGAHPTLKLEAIGGVPEKNRQPVALRHFWEPIHVGGGRG